MQICAVFEEKKFHQFECVSDFKLGKNFLRDIQIEIPFLVFRVFSTRQKVLWLSAVDLWMRDKLAKEIS